MPGVWPVMGGSVGAAPPGGAPVLQEVALSYTPGAGIPDTTVHTMTFSALAANSSLVLLAMRNDSGQNPSSPTSITTNLGGAFSQNATFAGGNNRNVTIYDLLAAPTGATSVTVTYSADNALLFAVAVLTLAARVTSQTRAETSASKNLQHIDPPGYTSGATEVWGVAGGSMNGNHGGITPTPGWQNAITETRYAGQMMSAGSEGTVSGEELPFTTQNGRRNDSLTCWYTGG